MKRELVTPIVEQWLTLLAPVTVRIEAAGSYRREKPEIGHDIDLVCIPKTEPKLDMFNMPTGQDVSLLELWFATHNDGSLFYLNQNGPKKKKLTLLNDFHLDLWIVKPETWGVLFAIRTGSADYSHWFVTSRQGGGGCPSHLQVKDGRVIHRVTGEIYNTPEEIDFFALLGIPYREPRLREITQS